MPKHKYSRREILKLVIWTTITSLTGIVGGNFYARKIEPDWLQISTLDLKFPHLPTAFDGYKIVHITDLHADARWMTAERLAAIVDLVNRLAADLIVITGDFVSVAPERVYDDLVPNLSRLTASNGAFAVLGNHDHWTNAKQVRAILKASNITELENFTTKIKRGDETIYFSGLDDYWEKQHDLAAAMTRLPEDSFAILLVHEPDFADISAATGRYALQLSGHSHGGQVILPFFGPLITPIHGRKYPVGLYKIDDMLLYTNRGLGMIQPYVRFNCRPEIAVLTLRKA